jgi:hypothetical protein
MRAGLPPITAPPSLTDGAHLSRPSSPNPPLLHAHVSSPAEFPMSSWPHIECSHHLSAHMSTCRREPSHRLLILCSIMSTLPTVLLPPIAAPAGTPTCGLHGARCCSASTPRERTPTLSLCHRAKSSLPSLTPCSGPHCFQAMHGYKKQPSVLLVVRAIGLLYASGKSSPPCSPLFSTTPLVPSYLSPPLSPCVGPGASPDLVAAPRPGGPAPSSPLSSSAVDRAGEFHISIIHPPRCNLVPWTVSGRCAEGHGCAPWRPSYGSSSHRPSLAAPRCALDGDLNMVYP